MHMTKLIRPFTFLAAASVALFLAPRAHAQLETFDTITSYNGAGIIGFTGGNTALTQTFSDVLELQTVTYALTTTGTDNVSQNVAAYLVQWGTSGPSNNTPLTTITAPTSVGGSDSTVAVSSSPIATFTIPPAGTGAWTTGTFQSSGTYASYSITLNLNQLTDPSLTYAIVLIDTTNSSGLGLLDVNSNPDAFIYGAGLQSQGDSTLTAMQNDPNASYGIGRTTADYGFSQIVVVPAGNVIPVPEPRTAAAIICALFVAGLVGRQLLLRRKDEVAVAGMAA